MKKRRVWDIKPPLLILGASLLLCVGAMYFVNRQMFFVELGLTVSVFAVVGWRLMLVKRDIWRTLSRVANRLNQTERSSLSDSPLPVVVCSGGGEILWYNEKFNNEVLEKGDVFGDSISTVTGGIPISELKKSNSAEINHGSHRYTVYISHIEDNGSVTHILHYIENTRLKLISEEYTLSRPAVVLFYIDNMDELLLNARDSERAQITGKVQTMLEDWTSSTTGILRRYTSDRFLFIVEQRHLQHMILKKFDILDRVRTIQTDSNLNATLSIGVGQGANFKESEQLSRQAIDMALSRGGDQAAVKTKNGFDFYGGISRGIEKRTKVRTRVIASSLQELIIGSDNVLCMGHRYSDLDCLGSATALASCVRSFGKPANVVVRREQSLAHQLIMRYEEAGLSDLFIESEEASRLITDNTLLIVTDTHNLRMLEFEEIYRAVGNVVVIDHHRKMVDHIDNAVIFYHEPNASSTSEMVAELVQYLDGVKISKLDAEALLAGIMLDTRGFVFKSGVRTFEAAAYLRRMGADTVEVKQLFSENMQTYMDKADIVARAEIYGHSAVSIYKSGRGSELRVAAAQAADDLLYIKGIEASFVIFSERGRAVISARSLGKINVQLIMESLGGGGHHTMAGAQIADVSLEQARDMLKIEIDRYQQEHRVALDTQSVV
ncbi:MAG: DHH family phosphoesterase [Oscillospiraceae bacterium]|nr:DHH family phosphoesterase [Oscillospiraceae bacterium]MDD4413633.1 DHH family phosphoesterase [Oscillospiraceae bacterium]